MSLLHRFHCNYNAAPTYKYTFFQCSILCYFNETSPQNTNNHKTSMQQSRRLKPVITKTRLFKYIENFTSKIWFFLDKNSDIFHISAQNIDCGYSLEPPRRGGSNEYPQSMFLSRNKKNNVYLCKPQFYCIKEGLRGSKLYRYVFVMATEKHTLDYDVPKHR